MRKNIHQTIFDWLVKLDIVTDGQLRADGRSQSGGFMDLVFEKLPYLDGTSGQAGVAFSMAHYFKQNGDPCQDRKWWCWSTQTLQWRKRIAFSRPSRPFTRTCTRSQASTGRN